MQLASSSHQKPDEWLSWRLALSARRVASTEHPAADREEVVAEHYPVDDIAVRTPCELLYQLRKKLKVVAHGVAEVPVQGGTIHGMAIPEGYARVMVDRVEKGWEDLDLEIPGGDGEEELGQSPTLGSVGKTIHKNCRKGS